MLTFHSNTINGRRATVVGRFQPESSELDLAIAICSPRDNFNKKRGRVIAIGRLSKDIHPKKQSVTITGEFNTAKFITAASAYVDEAIEARETL